MEDYLDFKINAVIDNANRQATDRQNAVTDAAEAIAEYLFTWGKREEKGRTAWSISVPQNILDDVVNSSGDRLSEMWATAAKELSLDWKAEEQGKKY